MKNIHVLPTDKPSRLVRFFTNKFHLCKEILPIQDEEQYQNIYITSDEEIKKGDWYYLPRTNSVYKCIEDPTELNLERRLGIAKIILTTDGDLIKDGIQPIDDEFLEWFVKNPSCERVETYSLGIENSDTGESGHYKYEIIIPKGEPKKVLTEEDIWSKEDIDAITDYINKETLSTKLHKGKVVDESYPKEFKQETIEEDDFTVLEEELIKEAKMVWKEQHPNPIEMALFGAKWQQEQSYSVDEVEDLIYKICGTVARLQGITLNGNHINTAYNQHKTK
jgi:hypothetical protein